MGRNNQKIITTVGVGIFILLLAWRLVINNEESIEIWVDSYQILAIFGGLIGIFFARNWGGAKSLIGRAMLSFSAGLLLQSFGQSVYAYYGIFQDVEAAYPSLGDLGFFGSIPFYIFGTISIARASGGKFGMRRVKNKVFTILLPLLLLLVSYTFFLRGYEFSEVGALTIFLDFGYPLGQAVYIALAITTFIVTQKVLGGLLKQPVLLLLFALLIQYAADFTFLYRVSRDLYVLGGGTDILYLIAYFFMFMALNKIGQVSHKLNGAL